MAGSFHSIICPYSAVSCACSFYLALMFISLMGVDQFVTINMLPGGVNY